ncbi:MAG: cation diffusion facilitator family transporter [Desulfonatronovibrio sp.]
MKSEKHALILSAVAALVIGAMATAFTLMANSRAILLDGLFNVSYFAIALLTIRVARMSARPDDDLFPFGYGYFEAFINAFKGLLILGVSLFALFDSLVTIFKGGRDIIAGPAVIYSGLASLICVVVLLLLRSQRKGASPLVQADIQNWTVNSAISITVLLAFCLVWILEGTDWTHLLGYVDPVLVSLVVCISIGIPVRMAWSAGMALLNRAPPPKVRQPVEAAIRSVLANLAAREVYVRITQPGRVPYILVHVLLPEDHEPLTINIMDSYRFRILEAVAKIHQPVVIDVVFTMIEKFASPTAGFSQADTKD